jgi:phosphate-selective porin
MKLNHLVFSEGIISVVAAGPVRGDEPTDAIKALRQQIEQLDQKIGVLERRQELDKESPTEAAKTAPNISAGNAGVSISSVDANFVFEIHGLLQVDKRTFSLKDGQSGAFQIEARYGELDVDNAAFPNFANPAASASAAQAWAGGLNWYLNKNLRVNTSFSRTTFTGGGKASGSAATRALGIVTQQPEEVLFTRLQLAF